MQEYVLWGMDGDLKGNEDRLMFRPPFLKSLTDGRVGALKAVAPSFQGGLDKIDWFSSEIQAGECGTRFELAEEILIRDNQFVAVIGPNLAQKLNYNLLKGWIPIQEGFFIRPATVGEYDRYRTTLLAQAG